jgi:MacB-like periplasmic core domain
MSMMKLETSNVPAVSAKLASWRAQMALALILGAGSGVAFTLLSLVNGVIGSQPSGQVLELFHSNLDSRRVGAFTYAEIQHLRSDRELFAAVAAYSPVPLTLKDANGQNRVNGSFVTAEYFATIGARFIAGEGLSCNESGGAVPCFQVALSQQLWEGRFASDLRIVGRKISIDDRDFIVRGVLVSDSPRLDIDRNSQLWISAQAEPSLLAFNWLGQDSNVRWLRPVVRIRSGPRPAAVLSGVKNLLTKPEFQAGGANDFILLSPGQAKIASTFRVRGEIVKWLGSRVSLAVFAFVLLWSIGLNVFLAWRANWHAHFKNLLAVSLAATVIAGATTLVSTRTLISFLRSFGVAEIGQRPSFNLRSFIFLLLVLAGGSVLSYGLQHMLQRSARTTGSPDGRLQLWPFASEHRYLLLSGCLMALVAGFTYNGIYGTDFWHHAAVVRELATHPLHPRNPILPLSAPHEGFSPYGLLVAGLSRVTGLSAVDALIIIGFFNLLLLLITLRGFVRATFPSKHTDFYALLLMLVLWGIRPWMLSGFLHLNYLIRGTAYPSTFAIALTFLAWYIAVLAVKGRAMWLLLLLIPITTIVFLVHPMSAGSMAIGCVVLTFCLAKGPLLLPLRMAAICVVGFLPALAWPYYPFRALIFGGSAYFDVTNAELYSAGAMLGSMLFSALIGIPLLFLRFRKNRRDFLVSMFGCFTLVYLLGGVTGKFVLGRTMFFMVFMLQLAVAGWLAENEAVREAAGAFRGGPWLRHLTLISTAAGCLTMLPGLISAVPIFQNSYGDYAFLPRFVGQYDTVLSDFSTSLKIPAIAGKVVSLEPDQVMIFVDHTEAEKDIERFFEVATSQQRMQILRRYGVSFVLLNKYKADNWSMVLRSLAGATSIVYADGDMLLLRVCKV